MAFLDFLNKRKNEIVKKEILEKESNANTKEFYSLMNSNSRRIKNGKSNCIGTALYLVGETDQDEYLWKGCQSFFNKMAKSNQPELGYLVVWTNLEDTIYHAAVITGKAPLTIAMRNGVDGPFYPNTSFEYADNEYKSYLSFKEVKYFVPSKLQKVLEKEDN